MQSCAKAQPHLRCPPLCWQCLASATEGVRLAARIVDTPCNEMNTDNFLEVGGAPDEWELLIGSLDCSNQAQVVLSLGESCVSAVGRKSNQGCSGSSFGHSRFVELCKGRRGRVYSLEQGIEKLKKWSWQWILVLNLMVTRATEIMGQLTYFQMSFIIKIWKAVENEIIPVLLHHDPVEWTVVL